MAVKDSAVATAGPAQTRVGYDPAFGGVVMRNAGGNLGTITQISE
jgi:hypothetical protein